jgi:hypothetical protein
MPRERETGGLVPSDRYFSRRDILLGRFSSAKDSVNTHEDTTEISRQLGLKFAFPRKTFMATTAAAAGAFLVNKALPDSLLLPSWIQKPTENPSNYRPLEGKLLSAESIDFIGHRTGNNWRAIRRAKDAGINGIDMDLSKVKGIFGGILVGHGVQIALPGLGIVLVSYDRASSSIEFSPRRFEDVIKTAKEWGMQIASAELKRNDFFQEQVFGENHGGFDAGDIKYMHKIASESDIKLALHSANFDDTVMAAHATGNGDACYFRPEGDNSEKRDEIIYNACRDGYALFTDFNTVENKKDQLRRFKTPVIVGSVNSREQVEKLHQMRINLVAIFNNAPQLQEAFGEEAA